MVTLLVAYGHSVFATPGLFRATVAFGAWGPGIAVFFLATALVGLGLEFKPSKKLLAMRTTGALLCALLLSLAASVSAEADPTRAGLGRSAAGRGTRRRRVDDAEGAPRWRRADDEPTRRAVSAAAPTVDSLTQLPTRVYFEDRLAAAATKADATSSRLALLFIDLDGFKPVNDTYGHSIGDLVLEQVGQRLKAMSRGKDVVARVGGDEFLLLLSNVTTQEGIAHVADR